MDEKTILRVLAEQKEERDAYRTAHWCHRHEEAQVEPDSPLAQVVTGVRRSGKSTLCHKVLRDTGTDYAYTNFDDDRLHGLRCQDLDTLLSCLYQIYGTGIRHIFFDEIQDVEGWHLFVNRLLRQGFRIMLTGSNARLLSGELATHLTGRYNEIRLYPFSFRERCEEAGLDLHGITTRAEAGRKAELTRYLADGGLPELAHIARPQGRHNYVDGLVETIIAKDIARRFAVRNVEGLRRMAHHLINNFCQEVSYQALADIAMLQSRATAQKYTAYLDQAFLIRRVQKFSYKSKERLRNEKAYVVDTGFVANRDGALVGENIGWRLENAVYIELLRRHRSAADDIYYYKPAPRCKEVDFVVCRQGVAQELVQVAYTVADARTFKRETDALVAAAAALGCDRLTLITTDPSQDLRIAGRTIRQRAAVEWLLEN